MTVTPLFRALIPVAALAVLAACGTDDPVVVASDPAPTVTVTVPASEPTSDPAVQITQDPAVGDDLQTFLDAKAAFIAYKANWTGGNLGADPEFQRLKAAFIQAKRAIDHPDLWLGENSAVTGEGMSISAGEAVGIGQSAAGRDATAVDVDLDEDDGVLIWQIEYSNGIEVTVHADTGAILEVDD